MTKILSQPMPGKLMNDLLMHAMSQTYKDLHAWLTLSLKFSNILVK